MGALFPLEKIAAMAATAASIRQTTVKSTFLCVISIIQKSRARKDCLFKVRLFIGCRILGRRFFSQQGDIADVLLDRDRREQAEQKRHGVKTLFTQGY